MKRQRGRGRKPGGNAGNRPLESNGPDVKIRGTASQIYEKYAQYARDSQSAGDRVKYENYLQHAEHYYRIMAATMPRERLQFGGGGEDGDAPFNGSQHEREGDDAPMEAMKVVDEGDDDDIADGDVDDGDFREDKAFAGEGGEARAAEGQGGGQGQGRSRRRRQRRRPEGEVGGGPREAAANGGDHEARSALDALAQKQAAVAGG